MPRGPTTCVSTVLPRHLFPFPHVSLVSAPVTAGAAEEKSEQGSSEKEITLQDKRHFVHSYFNNGLHWSTYCTFPTVSGIPGTLQFGKLLLQQLNQPRNSMAQSRFFCMICKACELIQACL